MTIISTKSTTTADDLKPVFLDFNRPALTYIRYQKKQPSACFIIDTKPNRYGIIAVAKFGKDKERQFKTIEEIDSFITWLVDAGFHKQQVRTIWLAFPSSQLSHASHFSTFYT